MTLPSNLNIIQTLPVDLWNIIIFYSDYSSICDFMLISTLHKLFTKSDLDWMKYNCIYNNIIRYSKLNVYIYSLYKRISSINKNIQFMNACADINNIKRHILIANEPYVHLTYSTRLLREHLVNKIKGEKNKKKFLDITSEVSKFYKVNTKDSTYYIINNMIKCI